MLPQGFYFSVASAGFKKEAKKDCAMLLSEQIATCAGVFTQNIFKAAPVVYCMQELAKSSLVQGILVNSGNANACTGDIGKKECADSIEYMRENFGLNTPILPCSTGVIGQQFQEGIWKKVAPILATNRNKNTLEEVSEAIMTTDAFPKIAYRQLQTKEGEIRFAAVAKGAGMISPNMATMLCFVLCDAKVSAKWWQEALTKAVTSSFNAITVDGDTSTNDTVLALANGASKIEITSSELEKEMEKVLTDICQELAYKIVQDAEGGTKVLRFSVKGAKTEKDAKKMAYAVGNSPLVKTALFGADANWGRIVAAIGRSGVSFQAEDLKLYFEDILVFENAIPVYKDTMEEMLSAIMAKNEVCIRVELSDGSAEAEILAADLGYEYVRINADYRT